MMGGGGGLKNTGTGPGPSTGGCGGTTANSRAVFTRTDSSRPVARPRTTNRTAACERIAKRAASLEGRLSPKAPKAATAEPVGGNGWSNWRERGWRRQTS